MSLAGAGAWHRRTLIPEGCTKVATGWLCTLESGLPQSLLLLSFHPSRMSGRRESRALTPGTWGRQPRDQKPCKDQDVHTGARTLLAIGTGAAVFAALAYPSQLLTLWCTRELFRFFEAVGIMNPNGPLGGQILGFNYQRQPEWAHWAAGGMASAAGYGAALVGSILIIRRVSGASRATLCGRCGSRIKNAKEMRCASCGGEL